MDRDKRIGLMFESGSTYEAIASEFGITRQRVNQILKHAGYQRADGGKALQLRLGITQSALRVKEEYRKNAVQCLAKYGIPIEQFKQLRRAGIFGKYNHQRLSAKTRKISWQLTFAEWLNIWDASGKLSMRGNGKGYCMARTGDVGPYAKGNVYICTGTQNIKDGWRNKPAANRAKKKPRQRLLTDEQITEVARRYVSGESMHSLSKSFTIHHRTMQKYMSGLGILFRTRSQAALVRDLRKRAATRKLGAARLCSNGTDAQLTFRRARECADKLRRNDGTEIE